MTKYHTYKIRLSRVDPKRLSPDDLVEVFVDGKKIGQAHRRQLPGDGQRQLAFGDNDSSSSQDIASNVRYRELIFVPGDDRGRFGQLGAEDAGEEAFAHLAAADQGDSHCHQPARSRRGPKIARPTRTTVRPENAELESIVR